MADESIFAHAQRVASETEVFLRRVIRLNEEANLLHTGQNTAISDLRQLHQIADAHLRNPTDKQLNRDFQSMVDQVGKRLEASVLVEDGQVMTAYRT